MLKKKRINNFIVGLSPTSRAALIAGLLLGFVEAAYPAEIATPGRGGLRIAPIRLTIKSGGTIDYSLNRTISDKFSQTSQSAGLFLYSRLNAASYLWQPWFSRVNSELGVDLRNHRSSISGYSSDKSTGVGIKGMISLKLIPESRFPFEAILSRNRDSQKSGLSSRDTITNGTLLQLIQGYKSRNGMTRGSAGFVHALSDDNSHTKTDKTDAANLNLTHTPILSHIIQVRAGIKRTYRPFLNYKSLTDNLSVDYKVRPSPAFTISNIYNLSKGSYRQTGDVSDYITQQYGTQSSWQSKQRPFSISGSVRLYNSSSNSGGTSRHDSGSNLNLGAIYTLSKTIRAKASANISDSLSGNQAITTGASITSTKNFTDISNIAGFTYKRYISGGLSNQNSTRSSGGSQSSSSSQSLSLSAGHSLTKRAQLFGNPWISNVNQVIASSTSTSRSAPSGVNLGTAGSSSWSSSGKTSNTTIVRINANDSRVLGSSESSGATQRFGLLINYTSVLVRSQSLGASLSAALNRKGASANSASTRDFSVDALVSYAHSRVFQVRNLDLRSSLKINHNSQQASIISIQNSNMASWDSYLKYHIGTLVMELNVLVMQYRNSKPSANITFTATRSF